jgi:hypothetical protein
MPRLTIRFESACVFISRPGLGLDACFTRVEHHRTLFSSSHPKGLSEPRLLERCRVEFLFDGEPAQAGACVANPPRPVDLAQVWPGASVREPLRLRGPAVPDGIDAWVWLGGGALTGGFTAESIRYVWDVPNHMGGTVLTDRASYLIEHDAGEVVARITAADGAEQDVPVATSARDAEVVFATVDPDGDHHDPAVGFRLDEFLVLSGVLDEATRGAPLPVPTLIAKSPAPSMRRSGRPVCSNALLTLG